ncbi:MAG: hypothetical protein AB7R55_21075, partial [Gemmatimonadales bacterium]
SAARLGLAIGAGLVAGASAVAQPAPGRTRHSFSGPTLAVDAGWQNLIGGALVGGVDMLQQSRRRVASVSVGLRYQTPIGTLIGGELGRGVVDGDLTLRMPSTPLTIEYRNRAQRHWGLVLGQAIGPGRRWLAFGYLSEVTRRFEVEIEEDASRYTQRDEQGLLRFGVGLERAVASPLSVRVTLGTSRADFGTRATNIVPRRLLEVGVGIVFNP